MRNLKNLSEQRGTLLVEAIAMLGLIALVTPTLYKKSAERLQEIQDINTASQARTMNSIVETFVKSNYGGLVVATLGATGKTVELLYEDGTSGCPSGSTCYDIGYSAYVPFGYSPGDIKNYEPPRVYVHSDQSALTTYIVYSTMQSPGKKRAARIASLVGSNGGMLSKTFGSAEGSSVIYGTGGAWELDEDMVSEINLDTSSVADNSLVVTSTEPINMSDLDSEKFLYRVPPDDGTYFHNTMVTDLYLGGHTETTGWAANATNYYSIFNVRRLTLNTDCESGRLISGATGGSTGVSENPCEPKVADLYIGKPSGKFLDTYKSLSANNGAAWIYGNLSALNENFRLFREDDTGVERASGYDVLEFSRKSEDESGGGTELSLFRAENQIGSARVSMMDGFVQVVEKSDSSGVSGSEFLVGGSTSAGGYGGIIRAYNEGDTNFLRLNSPDDYGGESNKFVTFINRKGGYVWINGGSSETDTMETNINNMGGLLSAGKDGGWLRASDFGNSSQVQLLNGADVAGGVSGEFDNRIFSVGAASESSLANMIYGDAKHTALRGGQLNVYNPSVPNHDYDSSQVGGGDMIAALGGNTGATLEGATTVLSRYTDILGSTYMGKNAMQATSSSADGVYSRGQWILGVAGSAWVDNELWARDAWLQRGGVKELHAGFSSRSEYKNRPHSGWLNVYDDSVIIRNRGLAAAAGDTYDSASTMFYADSSRIRMNDLEGAWGELSGGTARWGSEGNYVFADSSSAGSSAIHMVGSSLANIYTQDASNSSFVNIQKDAMKFGGQPGDSSSYTNTIAAKANVFTIQTEGTSSTTDYAQFYIDNSKLRTRYVDVEVEDDDSSAVFKVLPNSDNAGSSNAQVQVIGSFNVSGNPVFHVASNMDNVASSDSGENQHAMLEVSPDYVRVWANSSNTSGGGYPDGNYFAMLKINPKDMAGSSVSSLDDTARTSIYIRRGAMEFEPSVSSVAGPVAADAGFGYIKVNRMVSNAGLTVPTKAPYVNTSGEVSNYERGEGAYDQFMVNPAYTSVMHDIKLTTRGGARLSDILPDYVLKGVYNLNNNCEEGTSHPDTDTRCSIADGSKWAHPYVGRIPYAICPPGYRNMATIIPISFNVGQAGDLIKASGARQAGGKDRWIINPGSKQARLAQYAMQEGLDIATPRLNEVSSYSFNVMWSGSGSHEPSSFVPAAVNRKEGWFWGFAAVHPDTNASTTVSEVNTGTGGQNGSADNTSYNPWLYKEDNDIGTRVVPEALYFQQNTFLKTSVNPQAKGWNAYMGFLYDTHYWYAGNIGISGTEAPIRSNYNTKGYNDDPTAASSFAGAYVWNAFPVPTNTLEGHATVYCYFDRALLRSNGWGEYVESIDQLNSYKDIDNFSGVKDSSYVRRLNDPTLKYTDPW